MNNPTRLLLASAMLASLSLAYAKSEVEVKDPEGGETITAPLKVGTVISFNPTGIRISNTGEPDVTVASAQGKIISFLTSQVSASQIKADRSLALRRNPVETTLEITGHDGNPAVLTVTSLAGQRLVKIDSWQGENVDVTSLVSGIYILNINNQTFKFIKK